MAELPDSIILKVFEYLTIRELCLGVRQACHRWNRLTYDFSLWNHLLLSSYSEVVTTWDTFVTAFSKVLMFVEVLDCSNCEQLFNSDDKVLWDYVFSGNKMLPADNDAVTDVLCEEGETDEASNCSRPFGSLKKIVFPVNTVDLGFIQMLCILKDHFPRLNALERIAIVEVSELLPVLSLCNGKWREVHFPPVDLSVRRTEETWAITEDFFRENPDLKVLTLSSSAVDDRDFSAICHLCKIIEHLNISQCQWIRESLQDVKLLRHLKYLNLAETTVNDRVISGVSKCCSNILHLNISGCYKITDVGIADLVKHASLLNTLILNNVENNHANITDTGLAEIGRYGHNLRRLEMSHCPNISDQGIGSLTEGCHRLQHLDISGCLALTDKAIIDIANNCRMIQSLNAYGCSHLTAFGINALVRKCPVLRILDISTCYYVKGLKFEDFHADVLSDSNIGEVYKTEAFFQSSNNFNSNRNALTSTFPSTSVCSSTEHAVSEQVKVLRLYCIPLVQELISVSKTPLTFLDLSNCSMIANDSLKQIAKHCLLLTYISLRGCNKVQDSGVTEVLQGCRLLQAIDLSGSSLLQASRLTDITLLSVGQHCKNLVMLDITKIPQISVCGIKNAVSGCQTLKRLRVSVHPNHIPLYDVVQFLHETRGHVIFSHNSLQKSVPEILNAGPNYPSAQVVNNFILKFTAKAHSFYPLGMI